MTDSIQLPVGRFVSGSLTNKRTTGHDGKPVAEEKQRFEFGVAVQKTDPALPAIFATLQAEAMTLHSGYPQVVNFSLQGYSWKISDGDKANIKGEVNKETAGCYVFWFSSSFPPRTCDQQNAQCDPAALKRGYFVDVVFNAKNNGATGTQAGIYLNPEWVRLIAFGAELSGGRSATEAFANAPVPTQLPPGASATPVATHAAPGVVAAQQPLPVALAQQMAVVAPGSVPVGNVAPGVVPVVVQPVNYIPATPTSPAAIVSPTSAPVPAHDLVNSAVGTPAQVTPVAPTGAPLPGMPS